MYRQPVQLQKLVKNGWFENWLAAHLFINEILIRDSADISFRKIQRNCKGCNMKEIQENLVCGPKIFFQNIATLVLGTQKSVGTEIFGSGSPVPNLSEKVYIVGVILSPSTTSRASCFRSPQCRFGERYITLWNSCFKKLEALWWHCVLSYILNGVS